MRRWKRFRELSGAFIGIWLFLTYMEFFNPDNHEKMGTVGYIFISGLFLGLAVMMWLMTSGRLPAYTIEETKEKHE